MFVEAIYKWIKRVICLVVFAGLLAGCGTQNQAQEPEEKLPDTTTKAAADSTTKPITTQASKPKPVQFPDVPRKPRVIENKYGIYYEIFVRSFADSNGDGIGDFKGLTAKLDYINDGDPATNTDLGVNGIWLMPVNVSPSYHKYDVSDYYNIDPQYGTLEDFKTFLGEAHKRRIKVIMDLVLNHTSSQNPWFKESAKSEYNTYRNFYTWVKEGQGGYNLKGTSSWDSKVWHGSGGSYYYGIFWDQMPDLNYDNPKVREEVKKVARFWLDNGIDGFRLDAAAHIYGAFENPVGTNLRDKNLQWWNEFGAAVEEINPDTYLVGEVWENSVSVAPYYKSLDSLFNFDLGEGIINVINSGISTAVSGSGFASWLEEKYKSFAKVEPNFLDAPFLTNHDQNRVMNRLGSDISKAKLAAGIYLTLPGNPFIYYGEEIGMLGAKPDERIREPFVWFGGSETLQTSWESMISNKETVPQEVQQKDSGSLLNHYKKLIRLRQSSEALMKGDFTALESGSKYVIAYGRKYVIGGNVKESLIILHNLSSANKVITLKVEDFSSTKIIFESTGKGRNKINGAEIDIASKTTVILRKIS